MADFWFQFLLALDSTLRVATPLIFAAMAKARAKSKAKAAPVHAQEDMVVRTQLMYKSLMSGKGCSVGILV